MQSDRHPSHSNHHAGKRSADSLTPPAPLLPADTHDSQLTLSLKQYLKQSDIEQIWEAYRFGELAHRGQMRKSGEPYITHPVSVAIILSRLHLDTPTIIAALLHDVVEDTGITKEQVADKFGAQVAELVDGLSKLDKIEFQSATEAQAENFRKMLLAMSQDVRVILVKLADRLHNMQTLDVMKPEKRRRIARETLEIYAPIANRLGLNEIYQGTPFDLDDIGK
jgi:GTP pyrophosphokinase